jgi:hypothetical protein
MCSSKELGNIQNGVGKMFGGFCWHSMGKRNHPNLPITTMVVPALDSGLPLESVSPTSFQQVPQAGPAPAPGPAP